jgi:hypothetical protein
MARKRHSGEGILKLLREIEVKLSAGSNVQFSSQSQTHPYGVDIYTHGTLAVVMSQQGDSNKDGGKLTANTLKKVIYRVRHRCGLNDLMPDWSELDGHDALHRQGLLLILLGFLVCLWLGFSTH